MDYVMNSFPWPRLYCTNVLLSFFLFYFLTTNILQSRWYYWQPCSYTYTWYFYKGLCPPKINWTINLTDIIIACIKYSYCIFLTFERIVRPDWLSFNALCCTYNNVCLEFTFMHQICMSLPGLSNNLDTTSPHNALDTQPPAWIWLVFIQWS